MDRNKLRKIVLEELSGRPSPRPRRRKLGLADLLSESSDDELLSLTDGVIITNGVVIETLTASNDDPGKISKLTAPDEDPNAPPAVGLAAQREQEKQTASYDAMLRAGGNPGLHPGVDLPDARIAAAATKVGAVPVPLKTPQPRDTTPGTGGNVSEPPGRESAGREEERDTSADASTTQVVAPGSEGSRDQTGGNDDDTAPDGSTAQGGGPTPGDGTEQQGTVVDTTSADADGRDDDVDPNARDADDPDTKTDTGGGDVDGPGTEEEVTPAGDDGSPAAGAETSAPVPGQTKTAEEMKQAIQTSIKNFGVETPQKADAKTANESFHKRKLADLLYGSW